MKIFFEEEQINVECHLVTSATGCQCEFEQKGCFSLGTPIIRTTRRTFLISRLISPAAVSVPVALVECQNAEQPQPSMGPGLACSNSSGASVPRFTLLED
jgi:hypothetical protein